jgi:hypothetical protein
MAPPLVPENRRYTLVREYLHDHLGAGHLLARERMAMGARPASATRQVTDRILGVFAIGAASLAFCYSDAQTAILAAVSAPA